MSLDDEAESVRFSLLGDSAGACEFGPYRHPIIHDLESLLIPDSPVEVRWNHDGALLGWADQVEVRRNRLVAFGSFRCHHGDAGRGLVERLEKEDCLLAVSAGTGTKTLEFIPEGSSVEVNDRYFEGPVCVARSARLDHFGVAFEGGGSDAGAYIVIEGQLLFEDYRGGRPMPSRRQLEAVLGEYRREMAALAEARAATHRMWAHHRAMQEIEAQAAWVVGANERIAEEGVRHANRYTAVIEASRERANAERERHALMLRGY